MRALSEAEFRLRDPLHPVVIKHAIRLLALQNGVTAVLLGINLLMPWDTFSVSTAYKVMAEHGSEEAWRAANLILGTIQVFAHAGIELGRLRLDYLSRDCRRRVLGGGPQTQASPRGALDGKKHAMSSDQLLPS